VTAAGTSEIHTLADLDRVAAMVEVSDTGWQVHQTHYKPATAALADALYERWYTQPVTPAPSAPADPMLHHRTLLAALRAAHAGTSRLTSGWVITEANPAGGIVAVRGGRQRFAPPGDYVTGSRRCCPATPGMPVELLARNAELDGERGLWWTFSDEPLSEPIGRIYVNVRAATAPRALREITGALTGFTFRLKCPIYPDSYRRVDALVIYHDRDAREGVLAELTGRWAVLGPLLDPGVPPLTGFVRPGLAVADELGDGRSYGEGRCQLLAGAIAGHRDDWAARSAASRREILAAALTESGASIEQPWQDNR
jgi:HopA1 effector protein family